MREPLIVLLGGEVAGELRRERGRLAFTYDARWRARPDAYPISLSMPLAAAEHGHAMLDAYLWGLLPDNTRILESWARRFQTSARNAFGIISHVGEDCAGAIQFVRPDRLEAVTHGAPADIVWLSEADIAQRLRELQDDLSAWRRPGDAGQFSLTGAQPKTALFFDEGRWGIPSGRRATTHILKPPSSDLVGQIENEHFCLDLARTLGLPAADSQVRRFQDQVAIVVERYDRLRFGGSLVRVHQEDVCQALGVPPDRKYESEGGPGAPAVFGLLRLYSQAPQADVDTFTDAVIFNWLIAGTDAHAKNYSVLIGQFGGVRLAPLYDLASALAHPSLDVERLRLAMKLGGEYRLRDITRRDWIAFATAARIDVDATLARARRMVADLPDAVSTVAHRARADGLSSPLLDRLRDTLGARAGRCRSLLEA